MLGNPVEGATTRRVSTAPISFPQVVPLKLVQGLDRSEHGESAYAFGEGVRASRTLPFDPDAELARLREQLVVETTRRTVQALREPNPLDRDRRDPLHGHAGLGAGSPSARRLRAPGRGAVA